MTTTQLSQIPAIAIVSDQHISNDAPAKPTYPVSLGVPNSSGTHHFLTSFFCVGNLCRSIQLDWRFVMARLARVEVFAQDEVAIVHVMNRTVRRCFLMGNDPVSGKNFDHRKGWIENELKRLAGLFGIDLLANAILSNHFHLILRSRPDVVLQWDDSEVARRWMMLCPVRKDGNGRALEPNEFELNRIRNNPVRLAAIRARLSDISWWMRLLSQTIAQRANKDDNEIGKFWQARYRAVRLLDETAILACAAYVDLNPIRAAIAETLEQSDFTSVQKRIEVLKEVAKEAPQSTTIDAEVEKPSSGYCKTLAADRHLAPLSIDELRDSIGACCNVAGHRASDKGFLPMSTAAYVELLDWTARSLRSDKRGATPASARPIFERLGISGEVWCELVQDFGRLFYAVAGKPLEIESRRSRNGLRRYKTKLKTRELLSS